MREFILRARKGPTTANFPLAAADRPGFLEIVAHTVVNTLFIAGHIRPSVILQIVLDGPSAPPKTVRLESDDLCSLGGFDEVAILAVLQRALLLPAVPAALLSLLPALPAALRSLLGCLRF